MKAGTIDVTCKTRKDVLMLYDKLQKVDAVAFVKLYEHYTKNPIPSYFKIDGNEIYVTYEGQKYTCKCCGEIGHKHVDCDKRAQNFPSL